MNDYEKLVKRLRDKAGALDYDGWVDTAASLEEAADAIEKLIEIIQNHDFLESLIKPHWISVTEHLPKKPEGYPKCEIRRTYYLVALKSGCVKTLGYEFDRDEWQITGSPVVAWMPLPPSPEEA